MNTGREEPAMLLDFAGGQDFALRTLHRVGPRIELEPPQRDCASHRVGFRWDHRVDPAPLHRAIDLIPKAFTFDLQGPIRASQWM